MEPMALPTNAFLQAIQRFERERRMLLSALGPASQLRQIAGEATRTQRILRDGLDRSNPFARLLEDVGRTRRICDRAFEPGSQLTRMAAEADRTQRAIESALGGPSAFAELATTISRQQQLLNQTLGSAARERLVASVAISRSLTLSPQVSAASAAVIDALEMEPSDAAALRISEQGAAWVSSLDELFDALYGAIDAAGEKIDRRALLRFMKWLLPLVLAAYGIQFAHVSSDQTQAGLDRVESAIEEHQSESSLTHDDLKNALKESMERLDTLSDRLEEQLEEGGTGAFYIVVRSVPMTEEHRYHGTWITWLVPGQEVEVVERSKKWLRVIAYDLESGETHIGWVLKKYLKRVTDAPLRTRTLVQTNPVFVEANNDAT